MQVLEQTSQTVESVVQAMNDGLTIFCNLGSTPKEVVEEARQIHGLNQLLTLAEQSKIKLCGEAPNSNEEIVAAVVGTFWGTLKNPYSNTNERTMSSRSAEARNSAEQSKQGKILLLCSEFLYKDLEHRSGKALHGYPEEVAEQVLSFLAA